MIQDIIKAHKHIHKHISVRMYIAYVCMHAHRHTYVHAPKALIPLTFLSVQIKF